MNPTGALRARQVFLVLIAANAAIAIGAILGVGSGDARWQVLGTSSVISAGSLVVAANAATIERARPGWLPWAAAVPALGAAAMTVTGIWAEPVQEVEPYWKLVGVLATLGLAATAIGLLALPRLIDAWRTAQWTAQIAAAVIGGMIVTSIVREDEGSVRAYGVSAVIFAAATIVVLVGARVAARGTPADEGVAPASLTHCPHCGGRLDRPVTPEAEPVR
ncbi:MAG: hypothetical protein AAF480_09645 [Actinomycetota bacterium]